VSTSATVTILATDDNSALDGLTVVLHDISALFEGELARGTTTAPGGSVTLTYHDNFFPEMGARRLRLRVRLGQFVVKEQELDDVTSATLNVTTIMLSKAQAKGMLATLGDAAPSRVTQGNAIEWLCDNVDGWGRLATQLRAATTNVDVMQLSLDIHDFNTLATEEQPEIVLDFVPDITATLPRKVTASDGRVERLLLDISKKPNLTIRMQFPVQTLDYHAIPAATAALLASALVGAMGVGAVALGSSLPLFFAAGVVGLGVLLLVAGVLIAIATVAGLGYFAYKSAHGGFLGENEVVKWFNAAGANSVHVRAFHTQPYSVTHSKIVLIEGTQAFLLGSPFSQGYMDTNAHLVDEPKRGSTAEHAPIHDVSVSVRGPAAGHLQEVFNSHWNLADPADTLPVPPALPATVASPGPGEFLTTAQIVRTINQGTFTAEPAGEKGVLEAYLRMIQLAERFIYFENQYFTNDLIRDALIDALKAKPALHVILFVNVLPDIPMYPRWQRKAIKEIATSIGAGADQRFGAFTPWSHAAKDADHPKPRLAKNYIHAKVALADNRWATVGSANLDGASLDYFQLGHALQGGDMRNSETNLVLFEETPPATSAVDALRRRLWAEHLGILDATGKPDVTSAELNDAPGTGWLDTWKAKAETKRAGLVSSPDTVSPIRALPWPLDVSDATSADHLKHNNVPTDPFDLLDDGPRAFDFKTGNWR
jgi:phosphatidylserine/phosphatidylglycerophosphate/cardiolipin synthase-like enzyme